MADPHDLLSRATAWKDNTHELDKTMVDMSTLSRTWPTIVGLIAQTLILKTPNRLNDYQSAKCYVHAARAFTMDDDAPLHNIEEASKHLANLREAWKPIVALGIPGEHPRVTALAAEIEELKR